MTVDWKAALMVYELKKYKVNEAGISETDWFGQAVYEYTILHSGHPLLEEAPLERSAVVVLCWTQHQLASSWREVGDVWKAVSPRIVSAQLKLYIIPGSREAITEQQSKYILAAIVSVYAPTFRASSEKKEELLADLQATVDSVDENDGLLVVGDLNARVSSSDRGGGVLAWDGVRGLHGVGKMNEAGEEMMSFCVLNELAVMNTYFEKKSIYKHTWQHPGSKTWHCIDYVIVRQKQRSLCLDVSVLHSAECCTDHKLSGPKFRLHVPQESRRSKIRQRYNVTGLCKTREQ